MFVTIRRLLLGYQMLILFAILSVLSFVAFMCGCATLYSQLTPLQKAEHAVAASHGSITLVQQSAAIARVEYLDAMGEERAPQIPYLDDEAWAEMQLIEKRVLSAHEAFLEAVQLAKTFKEDGSGVQAWYLELADEKLMAFVIEFAKLTNLGNKTGLQLEQIREVQRW